LLPTLSDRDRAAAWIAAVEDDLAHVALTDAAQRVVRLRASGIALTAGEEAKLGVLVEQLPGVPRAIFAGESLTNIWRVHDPALAHVVPRSGELTVETLT
jgi:hypothetical protein